MTRRASQPDTSGGEERPERRGGYPPDQLEARADKIYRWFEYARELYERPHGRAEGAAEGEGFDPAPDRRRCEHRRQWMANKLCLACDNTGWRPCADGEEGTDPYAVNIKGSVTREVPVVLEGERLDEAIARLEHLAAVRAGTDLTEDRQTRHYRLVSHKPGTLNRILATLERIKLAMPEFRPLSDEGLLLLAALVPGKITPVEEVVR